MKNLQRFGDCSPFFSIGVLLPSDLCNKGYNRIQKKSKSPRATQLRDINNPWVITQRI